MSNTSNAPLNIFPIDAMEDQLIQPRTIIHAMPKIPVIIGIRSRHLKTDPQVYYAICLF